MKKLSLILLALCMAICSTAFVACGGGSGEITKADYAKAFGAAINTCKSLGQDAGTGTQSISISDNDLIIIEENTEGATLATVWFMGFLKNVCETESFVLTENYVDAKIDGIEGNGSTREYFVRFKMSYDKETSTVYSDVYCVTGGDSMYLSFEVVYNFETSTMSQFVTKGMMGTVEYLIYKNSNLYLLNSASDAYASISAEIIAKVTELSGMEFGADLPDYSDQYNNANPYLN